MNEGPRANDVGSSTGTQVGENAKAHDPKRGSASAPGAPRPGFGAALASALTRPGAPLPITIRGRRRNPRDIYHWLLTTSWGVFAGLGLGAYLLANALFACLYLLDPGGIAGARRGVFADAFFFSVETIGTIGYGVLAPKDLYANLVMTAENFFGLSFVAVATGVIFARVSRPTARVLFTKNALVTTYDGRPTFMFRAANERANRLLEADVTVSLTRYIGNAEGKYMRRFEDLKVVRARSPLFALTWTVMHVIDEQSPLFGLDPAGLEAEAGQILVLIAGMDETFAQRIHARHAYLPADIVWNRHFADVMFEGPDGRWVLDYGRFHDLDEIAEAESAAEAVASED
jgi:inward rectifier potassium channel